MKDKRRGLARQKGDSNYGQFASRRRAGLLCADLALCLLWIRDSGVFYHYNSGAAIQISRGLMALRSEKNVAQCSGGQAASPPAAPPPGDTRAAGEIAGMAG